MGIGFNGLKLRGLGFVLVLWVAWASNAKAGRQLSEKSEDTDKSSIEDYIQDCGTFCIAIAVAVFVGIVVCSSLLAFFCWRCCRRSRDRSFIVTDEGLTSVAVKAATRLASADAVSCPLTMIPPTGRYEGFSTDIYRTKCIMYCLTFHSNGLVSGTTTDDGRKKEIHGHYSKETRKYHWGETLQDAYYKDYEHPEVYSTALINGRAVHLEVEAQVLNPSAGVLEAHYFDTSNSNGFIKLTWTEVLKPAIDLEIDDEVESRQLVARRRDID